MDINYQYYFLLVHTLVWLTLLGLLSQIIVRHFSNNASEIILIWAFAPFNFLMNTLGSYYILSIMGISALIILGVTGWFGYDNLGFDEGGE